jgi:hypothetical protein
LPGWVDAAIWLGTHIKISIDATAQPNRIALDVPSDLRAVIPIGVVIEIGLRVLLCYSLRTATPKALARSSISIFN